MNPIRWIAAICAVAACAPQPPPRPPPEIVVGEVLVHTAIPSLLTTQRLSAATDRADFVVKEVHCLLGTCRVVVERAGAAADTRWTYELVDGLAAARIPGIDSVESNPVTHPR